MSQKGVIVIGILLKVLIVPSIASQQINRLHQVRFLSLQVLPSLASWLSFLTPEVGDFLGYDSGCALGVYLYTKVSLILMSPQYSQNTLISGAESL